MPRPARGGEPDAARVRRQLRNECACLSVRCEHRRVAPCRAWRWEPAGASASPLGGRFQFGGRQRESPSCRRFRAPPTQYRSGGGGAEGTG